MRRYAVIARAVVAIGCLLLGLLVVPGAHPFPAVVAMLGLVGWLVLHARRFATRPATWLTVTDVAVFCLAAVTQRWTVPAAASADSTGWVLAALTMTVVAVQWYTTLRLGVLAAATIIAAYLAGAWYAVGPAELHRLTMLLWLVPQAGLSRLCSSALMSAARRCDAVLAEQQHERVVVAVAAARRADERDQQALLHDTVAATLLMVGVGAVPGRRPWLSEHAAHDLLVLQRAAPPVPTDLAELLTAEIGRSPVTVDHPALPAVRLPVVLSAAIAGSVRETLNNVARHAGVDRARLDVVTDPPALVITDEGKGFDVAAVPEHRRGITLSIRNRMAAAGGRALVRSTPGQGTVVRLEWPDA
jgi:hypothetical protein